MDTITWKWTEAQYVRKGSIVQFTNKKEPFLFFFKKKVWENYVLKDMSSRFGSTMTLYFEHEITREPFQITVSPFKNMYYGVRESI